MIKFEDVLTIEACIDDGAVDSALVYNAHMMPEKTNDKTKMT